MGRPQRERRENGDRTTVEDFGFEVRELTQEFAEQLNVEAGSGVVVSRVASDGNANGKLQVGDVIEKVGNQPVKSPAEFAEAVKKVDPEKGLLLTVRSGDETRIESLRCPLRSGCHNVTRP